jgi:hypothetical protein
MGAIMLIIGVRDLIRAHESVLWPTVEGHVIRSEITSDNSGDSTTYHAEVSYNYQLSGVTHSSNRIGFGDYGSSDPSHAETILSRYPKGISIQVHYNPHSPELSVLETGVHGAVYFLAPGGLLFFVVGCFFLWGMPKLVRLMPAQAPSSDRSS